MEHPPPHDTAGPGAEPSGRARRPSRLATTIVAVGAAAGMFAAGLGIAGAQAEGPPTTPPADGSPAAPDGAEGDGRRRHHHRGDGKPSLEAAASALGTSVDELRAARREGRSLADVARSRDVDPQRVVDAIVADLRNRAAAAVTAGEVTQAQADARLARVEERVAAFVEQVGKPGRVGPGRGHHGHGHGHGHPGVKASLEVAATALGATPEELRTARRDGRSLADVARAKGVDPKTVVDALVADARARIGEAVAAGRLTQAQADERLAGLEERMTAVVERAGRAQAPRAVSPSV